MKTFLPPKASQKSAEETPDVFESADYLELCRRTYPAARRVAVLSVIPGLGQLKNGEIAKGLLFLSISAINTGLVALAVCNHQFATSVAQRFNTNFEGAAVIIYALLCVAFVAYAVRDAYDRAVEVIRDGVKHPRATLTLPEAASGSYLFHLAVVASFILMVLFYIAPEQPKDQVTKIDFEIEKPRAPEKPKPAPKAEQPKKKVQEPPKPKQIVVVPKPVVQPKPVVVKKVEPPKPNPVAVSVPSKQPTPVTAAPVESAPVASAPAPSSSSSAAGNGGGTGGTGIGGSGSGEKEVDMGPYMRELQRKIKHAWFPPKGNESAKIKVSFKVHKNGSISHLKMVSSSGVDLADDAATQAVENAAPFAPLPDGVGDDVDINFSFDYNVFGRGR